MSNPVYRSEYDAEQIEKQIEHASPIIQDGYWYTWDIETSQYVSTGITAAAASYAEQSEASAKDAEAWAVGQRGGEDVPTGDDAYQNNAKYYAQQSAAIKEETEQIASAAAQEAAEKAAGEAAEQTADAVRGEMQGYVSSAAGSVRDAEAWAVGQRDGQDVPDTDETYQNNAKYWSDIAQQAAGGGVTSFNGRTGTVVPQSGDYTAAQVGAIPTAEKGASGGVATQDALSGVESTATASQAYADGEYFAYSGLLYKATAAISAGDALAPGTNCAAVTVAEELEELAQKDAADTAYNNAESGLPATNVQGAIDELNASLSDKADKTEKEYVTEIITSDCKWRPPSGITGEVFVRAFGAGGGGGGTPAANGGGGGGGGNMQTATFTPDLSTEYPVTIGKGGAASYVAAGKNGGTTSFADIVSATGGNGGGYGSTSGGGRGGNGGSGGGGGGNGSTAGAGAGGTGTYGGGGGAGGWNSAGGAGGTYGGGGGGGAGKGNGGAGGTYGGGGGGGGYSFTSTDGNGKGGNGGTYGGGGGGGGFNGAGGRGGTYGGNGGNATAHGNAGTNTIGMDLEYTGYGARGITAGGGGGGGGGYGGSGGNGGKNSSESAGFAGGGGGGGGGYGGNGGNGYSGRLSAGGGGGGYGGDGGDATGNYGAGGGGGGYGAAGGDAPSYGGGGGGGGYGYGGRGGAGGLGGGGGGGYGPGGDAHYAQNIPGDNGGYGAGGGGANGAVNMNNAASLMNAMPGRGGDGIVILQYYKYILQGGNS